MYQELSYDELKGVLEGWLNPTGEGGEEIDEPSAVQETLAPKPTQSSVSTDMGGTVEKTSTKTDDVAAAFDDLFNN